MQCRATFRQLRCAYITDYRKELSCQKVHQLFVRDIVRAEDDDKPRGKGREHAKEVHQMDLTREQALAMARPE